MSYRPEIDGLRAVAVAGVVLYHLHPPLIPGGYLGVDVFFVLSGFLIAGIILRDVAAGTFSLAEFWRHRFRRIVPALLAMVGTVAMTGALVLPGEERMMLIHQCVAAVAGYSNMLLLWTTDGYWAADAVSLPLLHTWSLGVEGQFYLLFPLFLMVVARYSARLQGWLMVWVWAVSVGVGVVVTAISSDAAFYLLPTRMWELLTGVLLAVAGHHGWSLRGRRVASAVGLAGLGMVVLSLAFMEKKPGFPGLYPLLPCLGTVMVVAAGQAGPVARLLSVKPWVALGKVSYSLYLWHWPIIVFSGFLVLEPHPMVLVPLMGVVSVASYRWIEVSQRRRLSRRTMWMLAVWLAMGLVMLRTGVGAGWLERLTGSSGALSSSEGLDLRGISPSDESAFRQAERRNFGLNADVKVLAGEGGYLVAAGGSTRDLAILGSSHAQMLHPALTRFAQENGISVRLMGAAGGMLMVDDGVSLRGYDRKSFNALRWRHLQENRYQTLVLAARWSSEMRSPDFTDVFKQRTAELSSFCERLVVLSQIAEIEIPPAQREHSARFLAAWYRQNPSGSLPPDPKIAEANATLQRLLEQCALPNVEFVNIHDALLDEHGGILMRDAADRPTYRDSQHLNADGSLLLLERGLGEVMRRHFPDANGAAGGEVAKRKKRGH